MNACLYGGRTNDRARSTRKEFRVCGSAWISYDSAVMIRATCSASTFEAIDVALLCVRYIPMMMHSSTMLR